ncbi:hypothetical protein Q5P01_000080 [Channa striata]|uniref:Uncharacterized protein n=1 Tax=Channa striata TaxID=64152 RepID=A0AA88IW29_CHASR|nr:hypothetical protein Q5P01_000080 [Channa striata]
MVTNTVAAGTQDQEQRRPGRRHPVALQHAAVADLDHVSLTYPAAAERSSGVPGDNQTGASTVAIRSCMRPTVSKALRDKFPWLNCLCPAGAQLPHARLREHEEKARVSAAVTEEERRKLRQALPPAGGDRREARPTGVGNKIAGTWIAGSSRRTARYSSRPDPLAAVAGRRSSDLDPSYCGGEIRRPGDSPGYSCPPSPSRRREAGGVTRGVQSRGSHGQREEGLTLRLDNRSYREDRAMRLAPGAARANPRERVARVFRPETRARAVASSPVRRAARRRRAAARAQELHEDLAHPGGPRGASFRSEASTTCTGGVRGSVVAFLGRFFESGGSDLNSFALELQKPRGAAARTRSARVGAVRHRRRRGERRLEPPHRRRRKKASARPGSGRTERRCSANREKRVRGSRVRDERVRAGGAVHGALRDRLQRGAGGSRDQRLLTGGGEPRSFSSWCAQLERSLWRRPAERERRLEAARLSRHGVALAGFTGIPPKIRDKHWTGAKCELMFRTLKYVCDLWALKKPQIGPEYGFSVHDDGVARFLGESREALPSPPSP